MNEPVVTEVERFEAPFGRKIVLQDVTYESGLKLLRVRIREGTRFTILDIDVPTAEVWASRMIEWAAANSGDGGPDRTGGK